MNKKDCVYCAQRSESLHIVKVNLKFLPPASHPGGAGFMLSQSMRDFYGKSGTVTSLPPSPSVSPVSIIPPTLHTVSIIPPTLHTVSIIPPTLHTVSIIPPTLHTVSIIPPMHRTHRPVHFALGLQSKPSKKQ